MEQSTAIRLTLDLTYKIIDTSPGFILEGSNATEKGKNLASFILALSEELMGQDKKVSAANIILKAESIEPLKAESVESFTQSEF